MSREKLCYGWLSDSQDKEVKKFLLEEQMVVFAGTYSGVFS